jgi:hypothetical protein
MPPAGVVGRSGLFVKFIPVVSGVSVPPPPPPPPEISGRRAAPTLAISYASFNLSSVDFSVNAGSGFRSIGGRVSTTEPMGGNTETDVGCSILEPSEMIGFFLKFSYSSLYVG